MTQRVAGPCVPVIGKTEIQQRCDLQGSYHSMSFGAEKDHIGGMAYKRLKIGMFSLGWFDSMTVRDDGLNHERVIERREV